MPVRSWTPAPVSPSLCGLVVAQPRVLTCCPSTLRVPVCNCPCPRPLCGPHIFPSLLRVPIIPGVPTTHQVPSPLRSLLSPGVLITPGVFTIPQGPHYFLESLSPSVSLLSLRSLSLQGPHHLQCPVVPLSPSPLGFPTPLGYRYHHCTRCPHNLQVLTVPGIPITPGVLIIPQDPHYSLESLLPSAFPLSRCSPLLLKTPGSHHSWDFHHPLVAVTSMFSLSLCLHHPWHLHCSWCIHHAPSPFLWVPSASCTSVSTHPALGCSSRLCHHPGKAVTSGDQINAPLDMVVGCKGAGGEWIFSTSALEPKEGKGPQA